MVPDPLKYAQNEEDAWRELVLFIGPKVYG